MPSNFSVGLRKHLWASASVLELLLLSLTVLHHGHQRKTNTLKLSHFQKQISADCDREWWRESYFVSTIYTSFKTRSLLAGELRVCRLRGKSSCCSCGAPGFDSHHLHGSSQIICNDTVPGDPTLFLSSMHQIYTGIHAGKTHVHKK